MATLVVGNRCSVTLTRKSIGFALLTGASVMLLGTIVVPFFVREQFLRQLKQWASIPGRALHVESGAACLGPRMPRRIRLDLSPQASLEAESPQLRLSLGGYVPVVVDKAQLSLKGTPSSLWDQWLKRDELLNFPFTVRDLVIDYRDVSIGRVFMRAIRAETRNDQLVLAARELTFNGQSWKDATVTIARPKTAIVVRIGEQEPASKPIEFKYFPSQGVAAEWFLEIPSRPLSLLLASVGAGHTSDDIRTRVSGVITVTIPDDSKRVAHANGQFVFDNWFLPKWPEAKAITGASGAMGVRMHPGPTAATWELARVEVGAGIFTLVGAGKVSFGAVTHLTSEAKGSLNCDQLAAHLPVSRYRDQVGDYLERRAQRNASRTATPAKTETVELTLAVDLAAGVGGHSRVSWHLSPGCGLNELSCENAVSSSGGAQ